MGKDKIKFDENSQLFVKRLLRQVVDQNGVIRNQYVREKINRDISLGSIVKPKNTDILEFDWKNTEQPNLDSIFKGLFRRFGG
jgi:hypothetical protein